MKLILQAIKALLRKIENCLSDLRTKVQKTQDVAENALVQVQTAMPLFINLIYDASKDADVCDTPFEQIEEAYLAGRLVVFGDYGLPTKFVAGEYIQFKKIKWSETKVQHITCKITPYSFTQSYDKPINLS